MSSAHDLEYGARSARRLAERVANLLEKRNLTLAIAESATGGLISHLLTNVPGISRFLKAAIIPYSVQSKTILLGIPENLIAKHGVVSEYAARRMSQGARREVLAAVGLGLTGFCGPRSPASSEPVGRVCIAVSSNRKLDSRTFNFRGDRQTIKWKAAIESLRMLAKHLGTV